MKTIIALKGRANSGKSSTVKKTYQILQDLYPNALCNVLKDGADIKIIMTINGIKVGIESQGDPDSRLKESLQDFSKAQKENLSWVINRAAEAALHFVAEGIDSAMSKYNQIEK